MKEIEVKLLNINLPRMRRKLAALGAKRVLGPALFREMYFEPRSGRRPPGFKALRVRSEGSKVFLNLKRGDGKDRKFKVREELEIAVPDFPTGRKILEALGFVAWSEREKMRESYRCGDVKIEIDRYPGLAPYLEVEGHTQKSVAGFLKKIDVPLKETTAKTATGVIKDAGLNPRKLFF